MPKTKRKKKLIETRKEVDKLKADCAKLIKEKKALDKPFDKI